MTTLKTFLKDVSAHQLTVLRDDGLYRHLRFAQPGTSVRHFELITWPGYLAYVGDMGAYTFTRLEDMFAFFRHPDIKLAIDRRYWAEKCVAADKGDGIKEWSPARFTEVINKWRLMWIRDAYRTGDLTRPQRRSLWEAVQTRVLNFVDEGEHAVYERANEFRWGGVCDYSFENLWDNDFQDYTTRFSWCCYALVWGILQYDAWKVEQADRIRRQNAFDTLPDDYEVN